MKCSVGKGLDSINKPIEKLNTHFDYAYGKEVVYFYSMFAESFKKKNVCARH